MSLAVIGRPGEDGHLAGGFESDPAAPIVGGTALLDQRGDPDSEIPTLLAEFGLSLSKLVVVHNL